MKASHVIYNEGSEGPDITVCKLVWTGSDATNYMIFIEMIFKPKLYLKFVSVLNFHHLLNYVGKIKILLN
jgi:hypothetical protein